VTLIRAFVATAVCLTAFSSSEMVARGQVITVTTVNDVVDFAPPQTAGQLPGPDGVVSFREAVIASNNTPAAQTIEFAVPQSEFWPLFPNLAMLRVENSPGGFVLTHDGITIDFASQTRRVGDTNSSGNEVGIYSLMSNFTLSQAAITIAASGCTLKGLDMVQNFGYAIRILGNNNRVLGCHISMPFNGLAYAAVAIEPVTSDPPTGNFIGGTGPGEGNMLACYPGVGIRITGPAVNNVVIGNTLTTSHVAGLHIRNGALGTRVGGPTTAERNVIAGNGTGGGGIPQYSDILMENLSGTWIEGNYLGTDTQGLTASAPPAAGIEMHACDNTTIINNVISGYLAEGTHQGRLFRTGTGIFVTTGLGGIGSSATVIQGNRIGVGADGVTALPNAEGIRVAPLFPFAMGMLIGGRSAGLGNIIANNAGAGIVVISDATGVRISGNAIFANGAPDALFPARSPGIDLLDASGVGGPTPNDPGDVDTGGNGLQNYPALVSAHQGGGGIRISGSLDSLASQSFDVEFFATPSCDPSGFGQGGRYLGATAVLTDSSGHASFTALIPTGTAVGEAITATATQSATGNTSEMSACTSVVAVLCDGDFNGSGAVSVQDLFDFLSAWFAGDPRADVNGSGTVTVQDIFDFLGAWFRGC